MHFLSNTKQPLIFYVLKIAILCAIGNLVVSFTLDMFFPDSESISLEFTLERIIQITILAPIIETLILALVMGMIAKFNSNIQIVSVSTALFFGGVHYFNTPLHALTILPSFYIMSFIYFELRQQSIVEAIWKVSLVHGVMNGLLLFLAYIYPE